MPTAGHVAQLTATNAALRLHRGVLTPSALRAALEQVPGFDPSDARSIEALAEILSMSAEPE